MQLEYRRAAVHYRTVRYAWLSSMAALLFYLVLPWLVSVPEITGGKPYPGFRLILWLVAVTQVGMFFWWTRRFASREAVINAVRRTAIDPLVYFMGKKIAAIGMAHAVAVYGLVLGLVGGHLWDQYILALTSAALMIQHYPSRDSFDELERKIETNEKS